MFTSLKNKIKEETGKEVTPLPVRMGSQGRLQRSNFGSTISIEGMSYSLEQKDLEIAGLRLQCSELTGKLDEVSKQLDTIRASNERLEQSNRLLDESVKVAQLQKELIYDEQNQIQNFQLQEISKLKSLLNFREQEAVDQMAQIKQHQQQLDAVRSENRQLRELDSQREDINDDFERLKHSSQQDRNQLSTQLAALDEEKRHLLSKLNILENTNAKLTQNLNQDEQMQTLIAERRMLEQRLEEAHMQLSDIKSTWSAQNLALETQVSRLSHQVAAETTEKRKALSSQDDQAERIKELQFELEKSGNEVTQRDNKIKILAEEIDDLSSTLKEIRSENSEEIQFLRSQVKLNEDETAELRNRLRVAEERINEYIEQADTMAKALHSQTSELRAENARLSAALESETTAHRTTALKNAEVSQDIAKLKQDLNAERSEVLEVTETLNQLQDRFNDKSSELVELQRRNDELSSTVSGQSSEQAGLDDLNKELAEKNKEIKVLKQRLADFKKTLQNEIKSSSADPNRSALIDIDITHCVTSAASASQPTSITTTAGQHIPSSGANGKVAAPSSIATNSAASPIVLDEVNFMYLKHVIMKFLTSREVEARHLIKAVGTLLHLSRDEEKLLHDTLNFKTSWFGTRPELNSFI